MAASSQTNLAGDAVVIQTLTGLVSPNYPDLVIPANAGIQSPEYLTLYHSNRRQATFVKGAGTRHDSRGSTDSPPTARATRS
jgi:hypothetical protein